MNPLRTLAQENGYPVIDLYSIGLMDMHDGLTAQNLLADSIHPNDAGYRILGEHIAARNIGVLHKKLVLMRPNRQLVVVVIIRYCRAAVKINELDRKILEAANCAFPNVKINFIGDSITEGVGGNQVTACCAIVKHAKILHFHITQKVVEPGIEHRNIGVRSYVTERSLVYTWQNSYEKTLKINELDRKILEAFSSERERQPAPAQ